MAAARFDVAFEEQIIARSMRDPDYMRTSSRLVSRKHLTTPQHEWVWKVARETWDEHRELPTPKIFMVRAKRDFEDEDEVLAHMKLVTRLFRTEPDHAGTALEELRRFVSSVSIGDALERTLKAYEKGDVDSAMEPLRELVRGEVRATAATTIDWIEDFEHRQEERKYRRDHPESYVSIPTGIKRLDAIIDGTRLGEFGMVMGTTGRGKSIFMTHLGWHAINRGYRVLHMSLEMKAELVSARYDSRWTGMVHKKFKRYDFTSEEEEKIERKLKRAKLQFKKKLRIVSVPVRSCDMTVVRTTFEQAREEMGGCELLLLDSADHVRSLGNFREQRHAAADVYWDVKDFLENEDVAGWTTTHAAKEYAGRIAGAEAAAESYDKARIVDTIVSLNQPTRGRSGATSVEADTSEDAEPPARPERVVRAPDLELFLAKHRDGEGKIRIPLDTDLSRMLIREAEREEREEEDAA